MKDLNEYLSPALRKKWRIVSPTSKQPIVTSSPLFSCGAFDAVNAETLSEAKLNALYKKKHSMIEKLEDETTAKADSNKTEAKVK